MNSLVSIIVPTCGAQNYFISCLSALSKQTYRPLEVIVINNSLDPDLARKAQSVCLFAKTYSSPQNLYYGPSVNKGVEMSSGEFILCLNDDVFLKEDFIEQAIKGFFFREDIGMVSGKLLRPDRRTIDSAGIFLNLWYGVRERGYGQPDRGQCDREGLIFGAGGAAAFYRRKMLDDTKEESGWFDPRFRMFFEDLDLSWRAKRRGWKTYYIPGAVAYHVRGGSARLRDGEGKANARRYLSDEFHSDLIRNRYLMIAKNETFFGFLLHLLPVVLYEAYTWFYVVFFRPKVLKMFFRQQPVF